jgi:hypothetical protein
MDLLKTYPPSCEFDAITKASLDACDALDGLVDGVITDPSTCTFDATTLVGRTINCTNFGTEKEISAEAAEVMNKAVFTLPSIYSE